jgi:hypothetical protein
MGALLPSPAGTADEQGRVADALEDFRAGGVNLTRAQITCPSYVPWRSEAALAHLALGDREQARRFAKEELELAQGFGTPRVLGVAKRAAGLAAGGNQGELLLREAVEAFERADASLERARTLADLGSMLRRRNRRTEARELLREALDGAHRSGAARLAKRAETELPATGARPRRVVLTGLESLTASERRIAELASEDHTNREIAQPCSSPTHRRGHSRASSATPARLAKRSLRCTPNRFQSQLKAAGRRPRLPGRPAEAVAAVARVFAVGCGATQSGLPRPRMSRSPVRRGPDASSRARPSNYVFPGHAATPALMRLGEEGGNARATPRDTYSSSSARSSNTREPSFNFDSRRALNRS